MMMMMIVESRLVAFKTRIEIEHSRIYIFIKSGVTRSGKYLNLIEDHWHIVLLQVLCSDGEEDIQSS